MKTQCIIEQAPACPRLPDGQGQAGSLTQEKGDEKANVDECASWHIRLCGDRQGIARTARRELPRHQTRREATRIMRTLPGILQSQHKIVGSGMFGKMLRLMERAHE